MASEKMITLKSSDGESFEVKESVAVASQTIKNMIEDDCADNAIPLPNVSGKILAKVIEYCNKHVEVGTAEDDLKNWDSEFAKVDQATLFDLILAANYLNIKNLLDLTCQTDCTLSSRTRCATLNPLMATCDSKQYKNRDMYFNISLFLQGQNYLAHYNP